MKNKEKRLIAFKIFNEKGCWWLEGYEAGMLDKHINRYPKGWGARISWQEGHDQAIKDKEVKNEKA